MILSILEDDVLLKVSSKDNFYSKKELELFQAQNELFNCEGSPATSEDIKRFMRR